MNNCELSEWESITLSTSSSDPTVMKYDGVGYIISAFTGQSNRFYLYSRNSGTSTYFTIVSMGENGDHCQFSSQFTFSRGDEIYRGGTFDSCVVAYYKKRDYSNRQ